MGMGAVSTLLFMGVVSVIIKAIFFRSLMAKHSRYISGTSKTPFVLSWFFFKENLCGMGMSLPW